MSSVRASPHQTRPSVYVSRLLPEQGMSILKENFEVHVHRSEDPPSRNELLEQCKDKEGVLVLLTEKD